MSIDDISTDIFYYLYYKNNNNKEMKFTKQNVMETLVLRIVFMGKKKKKIT